MPPNNSDPGEPPGPPPPYSLSPAPPPPQKQKPAQPHSNAQRRQCGQYADAWQRGFGYGFRDALRLAARELPPETWHTLEALADQYELAGSDD